MTVTVKCNQCSGDVVKTRTRVKETNFCSRPCYWEYRKTDPRVRASRKPCSEETKRKISEANKGKQPRLGAKLSDLTKRRIGEKAKARFQHDPTSNPMYGKKHSIKSRDAMSETRTKKWIAGEYRPYGKNGHTTGYHTSTKTGQEYFYRSSWERECMKWLDLSEDVETYGYESVRIPYYDEDKSRTYKRHYIPDFLITFKDGHKELWEIKPKAFHNNLRTELKTKAAKAYCTENSISEFKLLSKENLCALQILGNT